MISLRLVKKQISVLLVFSILAAIAAIIHGLFLDLDPTQIKRLTLEGILLTFLIIFPATLFLEYIFDINNKERLDKLDQRLKKLERRKK